MFQLLVSSVLVAQDNVNAPFESMYKCMVATRDTMALVDELAGTMPFCLYVQVPMTTRRLLILRLFERTPNPLFIIVV